MANYRIGESVKKLDFLSVFLKSPIILSKLLFSKHQKSDWLKALVFHNKKAPRKVRFNKWCR